jgi:hypothetical protein
MKRREYVVNVFVIPSNLIKKMEYLGTMQISFLNGFHGSFRLGIRSSQIYKSIYQNDVII